MVALLQGLGNTRLDVLDVAFLLEVLATLVLGWCHSESEWFDIQIFTSVLGVY